MLRRSTSFDTSPMPMKMAMNRPKTEIAASPRSFTILTSCPAVNWPSRYEESISRFEKRTRLYGTRSRTDSRKTLIATVLMARTRTFPCRSGGLARFGDPLEKEIFEGIVERVERDELRSPGDELRQQTIWRSLRRQREGISAR